MAPVQPSPRVTIRDVAERAGVSVATVSKVINQRYGVAANTFAKVQSVIQELGYEASLVAQSLRNHQTNVIGILVADLEPFSAELLKGAGDAIRGTGFELVVYSAGGRVGEHVGWERRYLSRLSGTLVDGAVLVTPTVIEVQYGAPVVAVDPHTGPSGLPTVDSDNLARCPARRRAPARTRPPAHRADLPAAPTCSPPSSANAATGKRLPAPGSTLRTDLIEVGEFDPDVSTRAARALLTRPDRPTAIFAANDISAIATIGVARELGVDVPGDAVRDRLRQPARVRARFSPLTTVNQPIRAMGQHAIEMLIKLIRGEQPDTAHLTLATDLVIRQTTAQNGIR